MPRHLAIIMDGNGRWAELRKRDRVFGHIKGARVAKAMIETCAQSGLENLTLYAFSTENWLRPKSEVAFLMRLLGRNMRKERGSLMKNNIRFSVIGEIDRLPEAVRTEVHRTIEQTRNNTGMCLTFALSYGARQEIAEAMREIAIDVAAGRLAPHDINDELVSKKLQSSFLPDPDLIIRTSGECRLSNFMLWQAAYAEIYVTKVLWPDFSRSDLDEALAHFARRERRFGRTTAQVRQMSLIADLVESTAPSPRQASV